MNKTMAIVSTVTVFALHSVANSAEVKNQPSLKVNRTVNTATLNERASEVKDTNKELIAFCRKASSDIRSEAKRVKKQKTVQANDSGLKAALELADKIDDLTRQLESMEKDISSNLNDLNNDRETMADMSQQLSLQLQDAMNKQQQAMQIMSNIMKAQHDTLSSIIRNLK